MHIFFITILILNFFYASPSFSISGTVVDIEDNPISNVTIESEDGNSTKSDDEGYFSIFINTAGQQGITFKHLA